MSKLSAEKQSSHDSRATARKIPPAESYAYKAKASGFLAGRAIWWQAFQNFPNLDAMATELQRNGMPYLQELGEMTDAHAMPWPDHPAVSSAFDGPYAAAEFRSQYPGFS